MNVKNDIKEQIIKSGMTMKDVVDAVNKKNNTDLSLSNFSKKLSNGTIRFNEVLDIADVLGKRLVWEDVLQVSVVKEEPTIMYNSKKQIDKVETTQYEKLFDDAIKEQLIIRVKDIIDKHFDKHFEEYLKNKQS